MRQRLQRDRRSSSLFASRSGADRELFLGGLKEGELPTKLLDFVIKCELSATSSALRSAPSALRPPPRAPSPTNPRALPATAGATCRVRPT